MIRSTLLARSSVSRAEVQRDLPAAAVAAAVVGSAGFGVGSLLVFAGLLGGLLGRGLVVVVGGVPGFEAGGEEVAMERRGSGVILLVSPGFVARGWVEVGRCGGRSEVKRETWARARAEARVEMRRVRWVGWFEDGVGGRVG